MSIASELNNLENNIGDAYDAVNDMSGIIPQHKNMANLDQAIRTIPQSTGPTPGDGTLTIQKNGSTVQTFTANQSSNATANITVPTKTSDLTNDSGFISEDDLYSEVCGSGTTITFQDTPDNASLSDFKLKGETSQNGTPTPDAPVAVQTVTGENILTISDGTNTQSYEVNLGKNLAKMANGAYSYSEADQTFTLLDGSITATRTNGSYQGGAINISTGALNRWTKFCASDSHLTDSGGTYTLTFSRTGDVVVSSSSPRACIYGFIYDNDGNNTSGNGQLLVDLSRQTSGTYTLNLAADRHLGALVFYSQYISYSDVEFKVQIEKGSATSYAAYFTPIELCKIGDYQDHIYRSGDKWYVRKEIGKIPSYAGETISTDYASTTGSLTTGATIYYVLAAPTDTEITNEALIAQLEAILSQGYTYAGTNNITTVIAAGNEQGELEICYTKTLLPIATETNLGLVQIGSGLSITPNGVLSATGLASVDWDDIQDKPTFADVATTGEYDDLTGRPTLATVATSGDYDDLTNKPTIVAGTINVGSMGVGRSEQTVSIPTQANANYVVLLSLGGAMSGGWTKISLSVASKTISSFTMVNYNEAGYAVNNVLIDYLVIPR